MIFQTPDRCSSENFGSLLLLARTYHSLHRLRTVVTLALYGNEHSFLPLILSDDWKIQGLNHRIQTDE